MFFTLPPLSNVKALLHVLFQSILSYIWVAVLIGSFFVIGDALQWAVQYAYPTPEGGWASTWVINYIGWIAGVLFVLLIILHEKAASYMRKKHTMCPVEGAREHAILNALCARTGRPVPHLLYIQDGLPNAFVTGIFGQRVLALMEDIRQLPDDQLEAVMAHELAHIKHADIRTRLVMILAPLVVGIQAVMARVILIVALWLAVTTSLGTDVLWGALGASIFVMFIGVNRMWPADILVLSFVVAVSAFLGILFPATGTTWGDFFFLFLAAILLWFGQLIIGLILGWHSQTREFLADAGAAVMVGKGQPLADALCFLQTITRHKMYMRDMFNKWPKLLRRLLELMAYLSGGAVLFIGFTDVAMRIIEKWAPNHPSVERREKALKLFDK